MPTIEQYTQTDRKRTESVLHSLSSFLDKHCICRHKCSIKLEVICWPCQRDVVASNSDIAPSCFATLWSQWYYIRLSSSHSEYHSAIAEYHCEAIELARGEYNCGICSTAGATTVTFLFMHGHDFSIIPSWKNVILSQRAPLKQAILQIQNTRRHSYETER